MKRVWPKDTLTLLVHTASVAEPIALRAQSPAGCLGCQAVSACSKRLLSLHVNDRVLSCDSIYCGVVLFPGASELRSFYGISDPTTPAAPSPATPLFLGFLVTLPPPSASPPVRFRFGAVDVLGAFGL
jgi:hypothetical protein